LTVHACGSVVLVRTSSNHPSICFGVFRSGLCPLFFLLFLRKNVHVNKGRRLVGTDRIIRAVENFARPVLDEMGLELVEVEFKRESGWILRLFVDQEEGVNLADCATVSRQVSSYLEVEDIIPHAYTLEVSSPGLERPLKQLEDFIRFSGRKARIKVKEPINGQRVFFGMLTKVDEDKQNITLAVDDADGEQMVIDLDAVARARLSL
jgi:ribosome maturation factor RimP